MIISFRCYGLQSTQSTRPELHFLQAASWGAMLGLVLASFIIVSIKFCLFEPYKDFSDDYKRKHALSTTVFGYLLWFQSF